jgi:PhnB protein
MHIITYLHFPGQAEEALNFYKEVTGGEIIQFSRMGEGPMEIPPHLKDKIMHARIKIGDTVIYLSDTFDNSKIIKGTNTALSLEVDSPAKVDKLFDKLSDGGQATMPPNDAFWGSRFSMLVDKFGIQWMVSCELKK